MRRRDEFRIAWARRGAADPVLLRADQPAEMLVTGACKKEPVDIEQMLAREFVDLARKSNGAFESGDVGQNALGSQVSHIRREGRLREAPV